MRIDELAWLIDDIRKQHGDNLEVLLRVDNGMEFGPELDCFGIHRRGKHLLLSADISEQEQED